MADAKTILGERLAKGEITTEEYDLLISKLNAAATLSGQPVGSEPQAKPTVEKSAAEISSPNSSWDKVKSLAPYAIGGYLGISLAIYFIIYPVSKVESESVKICRDAGRSASQCLCFANEMTKDYNLINAPLRLLGIGLPSGAKIAANCSGRS